MKKGPNLRWSLIQCSGGDEGDRTPDLLTASQALSQLSYAPVRRSTIRELGRRCKDNFRKYFAARGTDTGPKRHTIPDIARGACPAGGGKPRRLPSWGPACRPRRSRPDQSDPRSFRGRESSEPLRTPSGQFTEPCVAHPCWSLHKQTGLLRRFLDFRPHAYFRKTGRQSTCGFTSGEISLLSYPRSNVVNRHGFKMALNYWQHIKYLKCSLGHYYLPISSQLHRTLARNLVSAHLIASVFGL